MKTLITALVFSVIASNAVAQEEENCGLLNNIVMNLLVKYNEQLRVVMPIDGTKVLFVFTGESGGWTLVEARPNNVGCVVAFGESYEEHERKPTGEEV